MNEVKIVVTPIFSGEQRSRVRCIISSCLLQPNWQVDVEKCDSIYSCDLHLVEASLTAYRNALLNRP